MYSIRQCIVVLVPLEHLEGHWERTDSGTYRQLDNTNNGEGDDIKPVTKKAKNVATDTASGDNGRSSVSETVELEKRAIKATRVWSSPSERMYILEDEKTDIDRGESSVRKLRRVRIRRREEVNSVDADADSALGETRREKKEERVGDGERKREGARQRGEDTPPPEVREKNRKNNENFGCHHCGKVFGRKDALIGHLRMHSYDVHGNSGSVKSDLQTNVNVNCGVKRKLSVSHEKRENSDKVKRHYGRKRYVCDLCRKGFDLKGQMQLHLRVHSGEKPFPCDICGKYYRDKAYLRKHKFIHVGKKPYMCEVCGKAFTQTSGLRCHLRVHSGEKPYSCKTCGGRFAQSGQLIRHRQVHTSDIRYVCEICGKGFTRGDGLLTHKRVHTGEKPFKCKVCGKKFAHNSNFVQHRLVHSSEKQYACEVCGRRFTYGCTLTNHMRIHTGEKPYECKLCGDRFATNSTFVRHKLIHTGEKPYK